MRWDGMSWDDLTGEDWWRAEKSCVKASCVEWRSWEGLRREEFRWTEKRWETFRWHEKRWEQLWSGEKSWERERRHEMGWYEMRWKKAWEDMRWDEMRWDGMGWDDTDYHDNGMQWTISKISCDAMRSDEMRKEMAAEWKVKRLLLRCTEGLPAPQKGTVCACRVSILKLLPPACPGTTCIIIYIWGGVPKIGVPPNHPFIGGFSLVNHPAIGYPLLWKPPQRPPDGFFDGAGWSGRILSHLPEVQRKAKGMENKT